MESFDFAFALLFISVASYSFYHPRPHLIDELNQGLILPTGHSVKIWNNQVCTITPYDEWSSISFTKPYQSNYGGHSEIINSSTCFYISNGETIGIIENTVHLYCSDKCL